MMGDGFAFSAVPTRQEGGVVRCVRPKPAGQTCVALHVPTRAKKGGPSEKRLGRGGKWMRWVGGRVSLLSRVSPPLGRVEAHVGVHVRRVVDSKEELLAQDLLGRVRREREREEARLRLRQVLVRPLLRVTLRALERAFRGRPGERAGVRKSKAVRSIFENI